MKGENRDKDKGFKFDISNKTNKLIFCILKNQVLMKILKPGYINLHVYPSLFR